MLTGLHHEPPITYDSSFDRTKNKLATLNVYDDNSNSQEWKVPIFSEERGLEELLYCEEAFLIAANTLPLPEDRYNEAFTKILCPDAQRKWQETTRDDNHELNYPDNIKGYKEAAYIRSDACKKLHGVTAKDHQLHMNRLILYFDKLQGHGPKLSQLSKTTMLLHTFPNLWIELPYIRVSLSHPDFLWHKPSLPSFLYHKVANGPSYAPSPLPNTYGEIFDGPPTFHIYSKTPAGVTLTEDNFGPPKLAYFDVSEAQPSPANPANLSVGPSEVVVTDEEGNAQFDDAAKLITIPSIPADDLQGCSFLMALPDGTQKRLTIVDVEDSLERNKEFIKFRCKHSDDELEDVIAYNDVMNSIHRDSTQEDGGTLGSFQRILSHQGPLDNKHPQYKGSK
eukprot:jgi/Psemu1/8545/gm1.8545_g